jgi:hypothetical protein
VAIAGRAQYSLIGREAAMHAFKDFNDALKNLPSFIGGIDLVGQHFTISDLAFRVQHEIDLYEEGEDNEITCQRRHSTTLIRLAKCKVFLSRCKAPTYSSEESIITASFAKKAETR